MMSHARRATGGPPPVVLMFPGQSSAYPAMIARARQLGPAAEAIARRAEAVLGDDAAAYLAGGDTRLRMNRDVQIAVFIATQMHLAALQACGIDTPRSVGSSLGEYSHLVHIGALTFEEALLLIGARGDAYDASPAGVMAAVLGVPRAVVEQVLVEARRHGVVVVSNDNTPTQCVIAGERAAVEWAAARLEDEHATHTVIIEQRVAMHSPLLTGARDAFLPHLMRAPWRAVTGPYLSNVEPRPLHAPAAADFVERLSAHVTSPVRWREAIEGLAQELPDATYIEVGPGQALSNMLGKRWLPLRRMRTDARDEPHLVSHLARTVEAIGAAC